MQEKQCSKCEEIKSFSEFHKNKTGKFGLKSHCKICRGKHMNAYARRPEVQEHRSNYNKEYRTEGEKDPKFLEHRRKRQREYIKEQRKTNVELQKKEAAYKLKRKEDGSANAYNRQYEKRREEEDLQFKLRKRLRARVYGALTKYREGYTYFVKPGSAVRDLGCSMKEFVAHLESQFFPNPRTDEKMSWDNWTPEGWHVDHVKPLDLFDLTDPVQFKEAVHYSNLQPLWAFDNLSKGNRFIG